MDVKKLPIILYWIQLRMGSIKRRAERVAATGGTAQIPQLAPRRKSAPRTVS